MRCALAADRPASGRYSSLPQSAGVLPLQPPACCSCGEPPADVARQQAFEAAGSGIEMRSALTTAPCSRAGRRWMRRFAMYELGVRMWQKP